MNLTKSVLESLKIIGLILAIALVLWTMPDQTVMIVGN